MINKYAILLLLSLQSGLFAIAQNYPAGASFTGMGNSTVMLPGYWSVFHNQAGLAFCNQMQIGFHFENAYFIKELSLKSTAFVLPTNSGVFAGSFNYFGYSLYNETKAGLAYSKTLGKRFAAGIQLDYYRVHIGENYGNKGVATAEIGILAIPVDNFFIGAHAFNPVRSKMADYADERLPTILRFGIGYRISEGLTFTAETEKDLDYKPMYKTGIEYKLLKKIYLRSGISTNPTKFFFGIGFQFHSIQADFAFSQHQTLGYTSHFSVLYRFGRNAIGGDVE